MFDTQASIPTPPIQAIEPGEAITEMLRLSNELADMMADEKTKALSRGPKALVSEWNNAKAEHDEKISRAMHWESVLFSFGWRDSGHPHWDLQRMQLRHLFVEAGGEPLRPEWRQPFSERWRAVLAKTWKIVELMRPLEPDALAVVGVLGTSVPRVEKDIGGLISACEEYARCWPGGYSHQGAFTVTEWNREVAERQRDWSRAALSLQTAQREVKKLLRMYQSICSKSATYCKPTDASGTAVIETAERPTIWSHGKQSYSLDRREQVVVTDDEDRILQAFVKNPIALDTGGLQEHSGVEGVARVVKGLRENYGGKFSEAIRQPGGKNKGGYFAIVRHI